ncbi:uncharacterized protein BX663DRAFT_496055 [Cokeromyces recurvatus]|uniref:uncharacterized protein n=1 Tax=Cokeromyces recurvatus TaxID=90255 RepID=UPI00221FE1D4|nr:uncharacterized protein BX663DRAFT_496055 [Cokeromyces recurvatus]KAI7906332.1 hypothetical protein BX663DRAFT_496055 [Cokeromyces recurvatus]
MTKNTMMNSIGILFSFIGMVGLILSIITLVPLNGYNLYTTFNASTKLLLFEIQRNDDWQHLILSRDAKLYFIFLFGSFMSSILAIMTTFIALFSNIKSNKKQQQQKSWFLRFISVTLLIQIVFSLYGVHLIYRVKSKTEIIPLEIQQDTMLSCAILCLNYLSLILFAVILLFASFCILLSSYYHQRDKQQMSSSTIEDERRPLLIAV